MIDLKSWPNCFIIYFDIKNDVNKFYNWYF